MTEPLKIGVSFAVEGPAADDCALINATIDQRHGSLVRYGETGNSRPHVTIALGTIDIGDLDAVIAILAEAVPRLKPFVLRFGAPVRETVTGQYVLADVSAPVAVLSWRASVSAAIVTLMSSLSRTTGEPHLTLAVVEDHFDDVDRLLARSTARVRDCAVRSIDVAHAGAKGIKGDLIQRFRLNDA
ncbi:2'-5' RNA ligase family protein [Promicromonospora citrea]|uniref:2'-5' RNA ligase superfamily protein n=1 Tax=Promicromonospora citrea TaxID=43677 RepID=A0A8H9GLV1_9MICO|nr:hypothetical protein [Promicromonospora citrea]NNH51821.1 hypothetical protein [Promicromonospora citrea]GGM36249.1 hypothetical protein GCM10010102_34580 [Promicromonospora citrea]